MTKTIKAIQHDTVDAICWRKYGRSSGVVEKVLEANPELSQLIFIPIGIDIILPDLDTPQHAKQTIQLWD